MDSPRDFSDIYVHEAGHVVAHGAMGRPIDRVVIGPGAMEGADDVHGAVHPVPGTGLDKHSEAIMQIAGAAATRAWAHAESAAADELMNLELTGAYANDEFNAKRLVDDVAALEAMTEAERICSSNLELLHQIADALRERGELSGEEANAFADQVRTEEQ
ncbi:hypothetical protein FE697_015280 [Mumia zhuanghuii]|uniref:Peptidase M41 domain-containing protein n=2 Tax=Mumia TaxID=1546255 RepID=A0ABW1QST5_9ACTN|nr:MULTISPECIES: hypothetical protein [Mumia]KAA1422494.1 hypothetical protein FE697_015280 [Mumia zhuanghuii]